MNKMILGAAGLLLSTSALAGVSMTKADDAKWMPAAATSMQPKAATGLDDAMIHNAMLIDWNGKNALATEAASLDAKAMDEPKLLQPEPAKPVGAMAPLSEAELAAKSEVMPGETEQALTAKPVAAPDEGMGGPLETADAGAATLDLSPRPATQNYPACSPGPGDDSCIQLYEPGVRTALASWSGQTGGFDNGQVGMGGPEEPMHETSAVKASHEEAAYEPLPEDSVMPAEEEVAYSDTSKGEDTLAI